MINKTELILSAVSIISNMWTPQPQVHDGSDYDFVIVGSGAGSVLANRLSEISKYRVLLVDAGYNPTDDSRIPVKFPTLTNSPMDWNFTSEVEPASISQQNNRFKVSAGKVLGGSSAINHLIHLRGVPEDFDYIATLLNDPSWKYENMLHYFKKSENVKDDAIMNSKYQVFHGNQGPMNLTRQIYDISEELINAFAELGYPINPDINSDNLTGYGYSQYIIDLVRQDTAGTYILSARDRPNLDILRNAFVTKVNIVDKVATGVQLVVNNKIITIKANKEVIVCAGAINSPVLLMLSGIGPKDLLKKYDIPVIMDLPVGHNLQEHVAVPIIHKLDFSTAPVSPPILDQFFPTIFGSVIIDDNKKVPQYQTINSYFEHDTDSLMGACSVIFSLKTEICKMFVSESVGRNTLFSAIAIYSPDSRGSVAIQSSDPYVHPKIKMNFYKNPTDLTNMGRYIEDFLRINNSTLFKNLGAEVIRPEIPGCKSSYWKCYAMAHSMNMYHPSCTCPMGTVLDSRANVKGVQRLRVVDASSLPKIPTANPLAAIVAVAEKISDVIKRDYLL